MAYTGGRLTPWFSAGPVHRFCHDAAQEGGRRFKDAVRDRTPVDTGRLRDSYEEKPVTVVEEPQGRVYESGPFTEVEYGPFAEHGTGLWGPKHAKYEIRPKDPDGFLHWVDPNTGQDVFAKRVMHPGSPGAHMFQIAAAETEAMLEEIVQARLEAWAAETEQQNRSDRGVL